MKRLCTAVAVVLAAAALSARALDKIVRDPCVGALALDAASGEVLHAENIHAPIYPASVLKLMDLLIILEKIQAGALSLTDAVPVTAEAAGIGGSQVYLKEGESFTVDEMLYALMIQSANDAAAALAIKIAGTREGFVDMMNQRARELGLRRTQFQSVHGLPPDEKKGQKPDMTTAWDLAILGRELLKHPEAIKYTSTRERPFRPQAKEPMIMRTHHHLLAEVPGCDGFKTGYFTEAGYSIVATARRGDARVLAVVVGSPVRAIRDAKAKELLAKGFLALASRPKPPPPPPAPVTNTAMTNLLADLAEEARVQDRRGSLVWIVVALVAVLAGAGGGVWYVLRRPRRAERDARFIKK